ncbi:MAG: TonB-dependent receptor [Desulfobacteraceae bacterium]|nr:TonB-dependent receptor [Desulfobacteraceae bacterium]
MTLVFRHIEKKGTCKYISMKLHVFAITGVLLCGWPVALAMAEGTPEEATAENTALMEMYFGKDQLVEAATRYPKPVSQIAENVTVVTADEIEAMHAHSVAEVLERVPGVFVQFSGEDFASISSIYIHGSDYEHVLVLVDGIRWNNVSGDIAETSNIPVQIIDRIEVIKGAASSAWGSSLGGVVNIITKKTGSGPTPHGTITLARGEHDTEEYQADLAGGLKDLGYYLYAGRQDSAGILDDRSFENKSLFGKFSYDLPGGRRVGGEIGLSQPENLYLNTDALAFQADFHTIFYSVDLDSPLTDSLRFYLQMYGRDQRASNIREQEELISFKNTDDEEQKGINSRFAWEGRSQTVVLGAEFLDRENTTRDDIANTAEPLEHEEIWAFYLNDTVRLGRTTITPGVRYDHLSIADNQVNPSLGVTYRLTDATLLRASVARGFRKPALGLIESSPSLESETIWTYQAGAETTAIPGLWAKATLFHHDADDVWFYDEHSGEWLNNGSEKRTGLEVALKTMPLYNFSLGADYTIVRLDQSQQPSDDLYKIGLLLEYANHAWGLSGQLWGSYVWWSEVQFSPSEFNGKFDTFIWDLVLRKQVAEFHEARAELFLKAHNLFNGSQYWLADFPNAPRWLEVGIKMSF